MSWGKVLSKVLSPSPSSKGVMFSIGDKVYIKTYNTYGVVTNVSLHKDYYDVLVNVSGYDITVGFPEHELLAANKRPADPVQWTPDPLYTPEHELDYPYLPEGSKKAKCTCPMEVILQSGCQCGGD